jgi:hypothetical protein
MMIRNEDYFIIDNWYENPYEVRKTALDLLKTEKIDSRIPGIRSKYVSYDLLNFNKTKFEQILSKKIDETYWLHINSLNLNEILDKINFTNPLMIEEFPISNSGIIVDNGRFQLITKNDKLWDVHQDTTNWASVVYLTPNAPKDCGTSFYEKISETKSFMSIENIFNRCIIYKSKIPHKSTNHFGSDYIDGRLTQTFFFNLKDE